MNLPFGLSEAIPENATEAWGARFIVTQDGHVDLPPDRQGLAGDGDTKALLDDMQSALPFGDLRSRIAGMLTTGILNTRVAGRVLIFTDENITIVADTKASAGYLYVAAFRTQVVAV
jgi:hypothetical protein